MRFVNTLEAYTTAAFAPVISFGVFTLLAKKNHTQSLNTVNAFTSLALFALLRQPMTVIINALSGLMTAFGSLTRIGEYLCKEPRVDPREGDRYYAPSADRGPYQKTSFQATNMTPLRILSRRVPVSDMFADNVVEAVGVSVGWEKEKSFVLRDLSFEIPKSGLTMVVGPVGAGKSTLLRAILGETAQNQGSIRVSICHAAFCSQTPWIMNVSIKKNILGAGLYDKNWYDQVIDACMLRDDLSRMRNGDAELVGNNGSNLSGGQQARLVSLFMSP
jgi:ATP-binding cassette subfamily C (CFTR/MRP) protein 1